MSCNKCGSSNCTKSSCCGNVIPATPSPYYASGDMCREDHCEKIYISQFSTEVKTENSWNVPDCGETASVVISNLENVHIGAYLWSSVHGFFKITGFNKNTTEATIENICHSSNSAAGTLVIALSSFILTGPPATGSGSGSSDVFPYVAIDFTAPNVDSTTLITVTTVNGLAVGKNVQIGTGTYTVEAVIDSDTIEIKNNGEGIVPGTPVIAKNAAGEFQFPIILIDANPCSNPGTETGSLIVCSGGVMQPLTGLSQGSVPVLDNVETGAVKYEILELPTRTCSTLTSCLTLAVGQEEYTVTVADSSVFTIGDILQVGSRTDRLTVTSIPDSTHIVGTMEPTPSSIVDIPPGTSICVAGCCELVGSVIDDLLDEFGGVLTPCSNFQNVAVSFGTEPSSPVSGTLRLTNPTMTYDTATITITNPSECRTMRCQWSIMGRAFGSVVNCNSNMAKVSLFVVPVFDGVVNTALGHGDYRTYWMRTNAAHGQNIFVPLSGRFNLSAGASRTMRVRVIATWDGHPDATSVRYDIAELSALFSGIGVAV